MSFNITSDGSPTPRKGPSRFSVAADLKIDTSPEVLGQMTGSAIQNRYPYSLYRVCGPSLTSGVQGMRRPLGASALGNQSLLPLPNSIDGYKSKMEAHEGSAVDSLLQRLNGRSSPADGYNSSSGSVPITPATDEFASTPSTEMDASLLLVEASELHKLKLELQDARNEVDRMNQEMHSHHVARSTMEHLSQSSEADYSYQGDVTEHTLTQLQNKFNASTRNNYGWSNEPVRPAYTSSNSFGPAYQAPLQSRQPPVQAGFRRNGFLNEPTHFPLDQSLRSSGMSNSLNSGMASGISNPPSRPGSAFDPLYTQYNMPQMYPVGHHAPIGTVGSGLSPDASEFNIASSMGPSPWNSQVGVRLSSQRSFTLNMLQAPSEAGGPRYVHPVEPMNYRRLLDRNMSCNWKYIVDKIICNNDQQASIFLQQKLKVGTPEQKYEIVEAIISQAYALMVNRFGNFLVQRCFEHGTQEQIIAIAQAIRGNTLALSMDAFGCHVIQKAFDCVPEEYKATMVHELLRRIPETVIHRYACHVWQKLFELRWSDSPPQIMRYVNEALRGMWHEVALGETGSLVVQNIFENCLEEDKVGFLSHP
ncbi:hypothetical protein J1614_000173 [Plenodomus biglobosus]|nr:hypothetical protein J1614_000173 [Plenodomus biglobosus]